MCHRPVSCHFIEGNLFHSNKRRNGDAIVKVVVHYLRLPASV